MAKSKLHLITESIAGAVAITATLFLSPLLRPWYRRWGATEAETDQALPGDDLVPRPRLETTRAITIDAPASQVWPWLVQMGQGRGGLYSYEGLENLVGCDIHNADRIIPEFQHLEVGDEVRLGPEGYPFFVVSAIEPGRALILSGGMGQAQDPSTTASWVFLLSKTDEAATRLIVRNRFDFAPSLGNWIIWRVFTDPISFVMERRMLLGIKRRAEATGRERLAEKV